MTDKEKKKRQHKKELNSLRNKMGGRYIVWFDSLIERNQYDILFDWKHEKKYNRTTLRYNPHIRVKYRYPVNFKYFIQNMQRKYRSSISRTRESAIDLILNKK